MTKPILDEAMHRLVSSFPQPASSRPPEAPFNHHHFTPLFNNPLREAMPHNADFVAHFREAAPYIQALQGKTVVVGISSRLLTGATLTDIAADLRLLAEFGIRLVVVHGSRVQLNEMVQAAGQTPQYHRNRRITDENTLSFTKQVCGLLRADLEAALSFDSNQSVNAAKRKPLRILSGNFVLARPFGVLDGIDMGYTGQVRKIDAAGIQAALDSGSMVLLSPLGHALSGRSFNLSMTDLAQETAIALQAEKLIFITPDAGICDADGAAISNLTLAQAQQMLETENIGSEQQRWLQSAVYVLQNAVRRCQILSGSASGSLLRELFTRQGAGTSIAADDFVRIRPARSRDIADIIGLIRPLEEQGILLPRSREHLENHIQQFSILENDGRIEGCVAVKTYADDRAAELACLAVSPEARASGHGERLLAHVIAQATQAGMSRLFALSTQTGEWFLERGFSRVEADTLPAERQQQYQRDGRASQVFVYSID